MIVCVCNNVNVDNDGGSNVNVDDDGDSNNVDDDGGNNNFDNDGDSNNVDDGGKQVDNDALTTVPETMTDATVTDSQSSNATVLNVPETEDEEEDELVVQHDVYALRKIRETSVHFRLRRTTPTLWRHEATCHTVMRVFSAIDDSTRLASPGVTWQIDGHTCTVLLIACLGYSQDASRSAKIADTRATEIIVRDAKHGTTPISFRQMMKVCFFFVCTRT